MSTLPAVLRPQADAPVVSIGDRPFDLDDPELPPWLADDAFGSGRYPYSEPMGDDEYERDLKRLQIELVKLQKWVGLEGGRFAFLFEGRDAGGKGGAIHAITSYLNPRSARVVALPKPSETERGQWYFQRYVAQLPTAGEMVLFDRSWYNRAGVEPVMGFCTPEQTSRFLTEAPSFERMIVREGLGLFKFWMEIGREMQLVQFHQRRHDPLKIWKLSPIDYAAMERWDDYTNARDAMLAATHTPDCPWTIVLANDKRRARLSIMRHLLSSLPYAGRDMAAVGAADERVLFNDPTRLAAGGRRPRARRP